VKECQECLALRMRMVSQARKTILSEGNPHIFTKEEANILENASSILKSKANTERREENGEKMY